MNESRIIQKLTDLHEQATKDASHFYVAAVVREAIEELIKRDQLITDLKRSVIKMHSHLDEWDENSGERGRLNIES